MSSCEGTGELTRSPSLGHLGQLKSAIRKAGRGFLPATDPAGTLNLGFQQPPELQEKKSLLLKSPSL